MQNPFAPEATDTVDLPETPAETETYQFPSARGWVPKEDFKPTLKNPVPTLRCYFIRPDGTQCARFAVKGTGLNGTNPCCPSHGGSLPAVKKYADSVVESVRMRILESTDLAVDTLLDLTKVGTADQVRLGAAKEILALANIKGVDLQVEVTHTVSAADTISSRLKSIAARVRPAEDPEEIVDAEVVDNEQESE